MYFSNPKIVTWFSLYFILFNFYNLLAVEKMQCFIYILCYLF